MKISSFFPLLVAVLLTAGCGDDPEPATPDVDVAVQDAGDMGPDLADVTDDGTPEVDMPSEMGDPGREVNQHIRSLPPISQPEATDPVEVDDPENEEGIIDDGYVCSVQKYRAAAEFNEMLVLDPTTDVIYPGALIDGASVGDGRYTPIVVDRAPMTISISLENIAGDVARTVENPSLSTIRQAISDILAQGTTGATPASMSFEIESVHSSQQMQLSLGANLDYAGGAAKVESGFDFSNQTVRSRVVVKFIQKYYSIDIDIPGSPAAFFANPEDVDLEALGVVSPMYVSTVTYGRLALFSVESNYSESELRASLNAAFETGLTNGSVELTAEQQTILSSSSIQGTILGGSGSSAAQTIFGLDALKQYIADGGNYSADSPGAPMSYKLRYMADNSIGNIVLSSEYQVRNCRPKSEFQTRYRVELTHLECASNDDAGAYAEIYGHIAAEATDSAGTEVEVNGTPSLWGPYNASQAQDILQGGGQIAVGKEVTYTFTRPDPTESTIKISGYMREEDDLSDDNLGSNELTLYLSEISTQVRPEILTFSGDGNTVRAYLRISVLP